LVISCAEAVSKGAAPQVVLGALVEVLTPKQGRWRGSGQNGATAAANLQRRLYECIHNAVQRYMQPPAPVEAATELEEDGPMESWRIAADAGDAVGWEEPPAAAAVEATAKQGGWEGVRRGMIRPNHPTMNEAAQAKTAPPPAESKRSKLKALQSFGDDDSIDDSSFA